MIKSLLLLIQDLRRNKSKFADDSSSVGKVTKNSNPSNGRLGNVKEKKPLISNKKNNIDRETASDSGVKPPRSHGGAVGSGVKLPSVVNKKQRPSSMHDTPKESKSKVEKKPNPPNAIKQSKSNDQQVGGFKKLQMGISNKKEGPVVITYEDEESFIQGKHISNASPLISKGGAGGRQSHIPVSTQSKHGNNRTEYSELKGASEHFRVNGIDEDGISNDQLDRLLLKAKNARN